MKRIFCALLCVALLFTAATAEGLGGLFGGLSGLIDAMPEAEPAEEEGEYVRFDLNGREIYFPERMYAFRKNNAIAKYFTFIFANQRSSISLFRMQIPINTQAGDVYHATKKEKIRDFLLNITHETEPKKSGFWMFPAASKNDFLRGKNDYFTVTVESMEEEDEIIDMRLSFEGVFNKGADKIENGKIHALVEK